jgi:hypothetical protein
MNKKSIIFATILYLAVASSWASLSAGLEAFARRDYSTAVKEFLPAAEQGNALAQYKLGQLYSGGRDVPGDEVLELKWLQLAANQGHKLAQYDLGRFYRQRQKNAEALKWLRSSALLGNIEAQEFLGRWFLSNDGVARDVSEAIKWLTLAALQGSTSAQSQIDLERAEPGLERGLLFFQNARFESAVEELSPFAKQGNARAQYALGWMYTYGDGLTVKPDMVLALKWIKLAANQNYPDAQLWLAQQNVNHDRAERLKWYRLAADQGHVPAIASLANIYEYGQEGEKLDLEHAAKLYIQAARMGNARMQVQVGDIYAAGKGVPIDLVEAFKWYARAADKNWVPAQCKLGDLYASGTGVTKDMDRAIYWYTKAADEDYNEAQRKLVGIITK